jgi:glutamyl-tRNA reductase
LRLANVLVYPTDSIDEFYHGLSEIDGLNEYLLLNTCNRTEIYGAAHENFSIDSLHLYLSKFRKIEPEFLSKHSYRINDHEVINHLFKVTSGIDSQMIGETEILGQVKKAYDDAL